MLYTNGGPTFFADAFLTLTTDVGKGTPAFTGSSFFFRQWNGTVLYQLAVQPAPALGWNGLLVLFVVLLLVGLMTGRRRQAAC